MAGRLTGSVGGVETVNAMPAGELAAQLLACCAAPGFGSAIAAGRPYPDREALVAAADAAAQGLSWDEVAAGLAAHPRIGERATGDSAEAAWSRREQSTAAQTADEATAAALVAANRAYEDKFRHVFLIFATGKSQAEILAVAQQRLANDEAAERAIVADELRKIALLRLERWLDALG
jgi:2-oxo-4-hydroxy-4-carboxy-5-ureidoimidazoline decarboxylase